MACGSRVMETQLSNLTNNGGSIPTLPLHVREFRVNPVARQKIKSFIEEWHYSKSINGLHSEYCFEMTAPNGERVGAAIFGRFAMHNQWKRFGEFEHEVIELRRLCCIDDTPKNTESFFIAKMLQWLKKNTDIKVVVSYADAEYGHEGTIYKASNFKLLDFRKGAPVIDWNGKKYHDKAIRTKYKGELKPFARRLREALESGEAFYTPTKGKFTYIYNLK